MTSMGSRTEARVTTSVKSKRTRSRGNAELRLMQNSERHGTLPPPLFIYFSKSNGRCHVEKRIKRRIEKEIFTYII